MPFAQPKPTTPPLPEELDNPIGRYLTDPFGTIGELAGHVLDTLVATGRTVAPLILLAAGGLLAGRAWLARWRTQRLHQGARFVEILLPPTVDPDGAVSFWTNLAGLLHQRRLLAGRPHVAFEYRWRAERLTLGLWLPGMVAPRLVEHAVQAAWPGARTCTLSPPPPPLPSAGAPRKRVVAGGRLRLAAPEWYALRTQHPTDPLRALLGAAQEHGGEESTIVQILARPARNRRLARCRRVARALRQGRSPTRTGRLLDLVTPGPATNPQVYTQDPGRAAEVRDILSKAAGSGWETSIRYAVSTTTSHQPRGRVTSRAHGIAAAFSVYADRNHLVRAPLLRPEEAVTARRLGKGDLLGLPELAAVAHLPVDLTAPGVTRAGARSVPPSPVVPTGGKVLGHADGDPDRSVTLLPADARQHLHVMGATGSGKSTLLANLALQDAHAGRGLIVIDPRGDLIRDLLDHLPAAAAGRVVLLDPDEPAPPSLNLLHGNPEVATDHLISIFRKIFASAWGPRTEDVLRAACLTLLHTGDATLADLPGLLTDPTARHQRVDTLPTRGQDRTLVELRGFWAWYDRLTPAAQTQLIGPLLGRLRAFLLREFVRDVVGATTSSFDIDTVLDGGILLARLPKGTLGAEASRLLGSMIVSKVWQTALARAKRGETARVDTSLIVDEAHNFLNLPTSYEELLVEARGYRLGLVLAHQHLAQLPAELREAISTNARTKVWFSMSPEDAHRLAHHVTPRLDEHDLSHLGAFQAAVRLIVEGEEAPACTLRTHPLPEPVPGRAAAIRAAARKWGRNQAQRHQTQVRRLAGADTRPAHGDGAAASRASGDPRRERPGRRHSGGGPAGRSSRRRHRRPDERRRPHNGRENDNNGHQMP